MTLLSVIAIIVAGLALTLTSILLVRTFVPRKLRGREQKRGIVFAFCGVIYALVVGFVLAFALHAHERLAFGRGSSCSRAVRRCGHRRHC